MKMKGQLDSALPMKKHKAKSKKNGLKKKQQQQGKLEEIQTKTGKVNIATEPVTAIKKTAAISNAAVEAEVETVNSTSNVPRQRVSKNVEPMTKEEQLIAIHQIIKRLLLDDLSQGEALRELRVGVLGIRQDSYTKLSGVSRKTLSEIENDKGNYTAEILNKVFKPFDIKVGLVPTSSQLLSAMLTH
ncbi:helix-turn-helix transcriptional regulator [Marinomonas sp. M1K-6]|uniref:Helix-turn-helix transcriptional regulator n=1 Tax=Marinomonas profundi TaxID=2726122 RepID=A0A847R850_9GAMM|nr:helix-turn-helix transcriptional regulator [Marinomonas profundi]NLQ17337.1 helix-turn-helix transcriptional regulator [Marinomonas profundi]UDV01865.1 helix-turn-helix transcriptional regulator [Marinomonas profundi]